MARLGGAAALALAAVLIGSCGGGGGSSTGGGRTATSGRPWCNTYAAAYREWHEGRSTDDEFRQAVKSLYPNVTGDPGDPHAVPPDKYELNLLLQGLTEAGAAGIPLGGVVYEHAANVASSCGS